MKILTTISVFLLALQMLNGQDISYSKINRNEVAGHMNFDIIGKVGKNYLIYKSGQRKIMEVLDENMTQLSYEPADFLPKNSGLPFFVTYTSHVMVIYQHVKDSQFVTEAVKLDEYGKKNGDVILLDNKFPYDFIYSENKQRILLYYYGNNSQGRSFINTRLYDADFNLLDEHSSFLNLNLNEESYTNFLLTNNGAFSFVIKKRSPVMDEYVNSLDVLLRQPKTVQFVRVPLSFKNQFVNSIDMKVDNVNGSYLINSFFYPEKKSIYKTGIFTATMSGKTYAVNDKLIYFNNSHLKISDTTNPALMFENYELQAVLLKKDGSFLAIAENSSKYKVPHRTSPPSTATFADPLVVSPYDQLDFLMSRIGGNYKESLLGNTNNPYRINKPPDARILYDRSKEILIFDFNSDLTLKKTELIIKKQQKGEADFRSFGILYKDKELQFVYLDNLKNPEIVFSRTYTAGSLNRTPTLRSGEKGHRFMPRYLKQVSANEVIIPTVYKRRIAFAKVNF